jgi:hypothetical protein
VNATCMVGVCDVVPVNCSFGLCEESTGTCACSNTSFVYPNCHGMLFCFMVSHHSFLLKLLVWWIFAVFVEAKTSLAFLAVIRSLILPKCIKKKKKVQLLFDILLGTIFVAFVEETIQRVHSPCMRLSLMMVSSF